MNSPLYLREHFEDMAERAVAFERELVKLAETANASLEQMRQWRQEMERMAELHQPPPRVMVDGDGNRYKCTWCSTEIGDWMAEIDGKGPLCPQCYVTLGGKYMDQSRVKIRGV